MVRIAALNHLILLPQLMWFFFKVATQNAIIREYNTKSVPKLNRL